MENWEFHQPKRKSNRLRWFGLVSVLMFISFLGRPIGQTALEAAGLKQNSWAQMVNNMEKVVNEYDGHVGIYIKDLRTGRIFEKNADQKFISASLIKLPIMAATFKAVKENRFSLHSTLRLKYRNVQGGSGDLKSARVGDHYSVSRLIYKMITRSDNTATDMLINQLGYTYLNDAFSDFGLLTTRIDPVGMRLSDYIHPARDNYTTPREMGYLLEQIYKRDLVSDGLSDLMLEILKNADSPNRLATYLPHKWTLARKTGLLRKNCHDVGIVFTKKGDFVICVLTRKNETYQKAKGLISSLGKTAYTYLGHS